MIAKGGFSQVRRAATDFSSGYTTQTRHSLTICYLHRDKADSSNKFRKRLCNGTFLFEFVQLIQSSSVFGGLLMKFHCKSHIFLLLLFQFSTQSYGLCLQVFNLRAANCMCWTWLLTSCWSVGRFQDVENTYFGAVVISSNAGWD